MKNTQTKLEKKMNSKVDVILQTKGTHEEPLKLMLENVLNSKVEVALGTEN